MAVVASRVWKPTVADNSLVEPMTQLRNPVTRRIRRRSPRQISALALALFVAGCGSGSTVAPEKGPEATFALSEADIKVVSGSEQAGVVASVLPDPVVIQVTTPDGAPIPDVSVRWSFAAGRGAPAGVPAAGPRQSSLTVLTDASGRASVEWELGTKAGVQRATAQIEIPTPVANTSDPSGPSGAPGGQGKGKAIGLLAQAEPATVSEVVVSPGQAAIEVGDTLQAEATAIDQYGNVVEGTTFSWKVSDGSVAKVDGDGTIVTSTVGTTTVLASAEDVEGQLSLESLEQGTTEGAYVEFTPSRVELGAVGETLETTAVVKDAFGNTLSGYSFEYLSTDPAIVTVDSMGRLRAEGFGAALVIATALNCYGCGSDTISVDVVERTVMDGTYPNQPIGMTPIYRNDGTVWDVSTQGWSTHQSNGDLWDQSVTSIKDTTNPTGSGYALLMSHAESPLGAGRAKIFDWSSLHGVSMGPLEEVYLQTWIHRGGSHPHGAKLWYLGLEPSAHDPVKEKTNDWYTTWEENGASKITLQGLSQGNQSAWIPNEPFSGLNNEWVRIEQYVRASSAAGVADGITRMWVNGKLVFEKTDWISGDVNASGRLIAGMEWYHNVSSVTEPSGGHTYRVGEMYISGREPS